MSRIHVQIIREIPQDLLTLATSGIIPELTNSLHSFRYNPKLLQELQRKVDGFKKLGWNSILH